MTMAIEENGVVSNNSVKRFSPGEIIFVSKPFLAVLDKRFKFQVQQTNQSDKYFHAPKHTLFIALRLLLRLVSSAREEGLSVIFKI